MNNSVTYIVGATVLVGGAYLFLKNKKKKDADKLAELGGATTGGATSGGTKPSGATSGGTTPIVTTPSITEPVKVDKDLNLDAYNLQKVLEQLKELENKRKNPPTKQNASGVTTKEWWNWYFSVGRQAEYDKARKPFLETLAKLGYKFENGLLIKI
jgi:LPXTG-motif cell wall-anchored protein